MTTAVWSQVGGRSSYEFINIPANARLAGLGGVNVSLTNRDVNFFSSNPALATDSLAGMASANYQFLVADIGVASFTYAHRFKSVGTMMFGVQHLNYGEIQGYDLTGAPTNKFQSGETAIVIGKSHMIGNFRMGVNIKAAFSNIAGYRSSAVMADIGGVFIHPEKPFTIGLALKNFGIVLDEYSITSGSHVPFDVQVGATFKPEHMPLRFSLTAFNLTKTNVTYFNSNVEIDEPNTFTKILSHANAGIEVLIHKKVNLLLGYNYFLHRALKLDNGGGGAGLSLGFAATIKNFDFAFARAGYVAGKGGYTFTISKNIEQIFKRKTTI